MHLSLFACRGFNELLVFHVSLACCSVGSFLPGVGAHKLGTERAASLVYAEHRLSLEGEGLRGWSIVPLPESANPPGANRASWPGHMVGTLWADKVLPGDSKRHMQEGTGQE